MIAKLTSTPLMVVILASAIAVVATQQFMGFTPVFVWVIAAVLVGLRLKAVNDELNEKIDNPAPVLYNIHAPAVWAQISETIATTKSEFHNVSVSIEWNNWSPPPGEPIFVQAIITIYEPELAPMRESLPGLLPDDKTDLRSKIVLNAWVEELEGQAQLTLKFNTDCILFRFKHNRVIRHVSNKIHNLVMKYVEA